MCLECTFLKVCVCVPLCVCVVCMHVFRVYVYECVCVRVCTCVCVRACVCVCDSECNNRYLILCSITPVLFIHHLFLFLPGA